jgi:hypothetical protein
MEGKMKSNRKKNGEPKEIASTSSQASSAVQYPKAEESQIKPTGENGAATEAAEYEVEKILDKRDFEGVLQVRGCEFD